MCCLLCMQVQFLHEKFSSLDIEVDGGLSPFTIDTAAQVCVCVCVQACVSVVSDSLPQKREESGELCIQAMSSHTIRCGPIALQYFLT